MQIFYRNSAGCKSPLLPYTCIIIARNTCYSIDKKSVMLKKQKVNVVISHLLYEDMPYIHCFTPLGHSLDVPREKSSDILCKTKRCMLRTTKKNGILAITRLKRIYMKTFKVTLARVLQPGRVPRTKPTVRDISTFRNIFYFSKQVFVKNCRS